MPKLVRPPRNLNYVLSTVRAAFGEASIEEFETLRTRIPHSKKTVFYWLKSLKKQGFLDEVYLRSERGRPRLAYSLTKDFPAGAGLEGNYQNSNIRGRESRMGDSEAMPKSAASGSHSGALVTISFEKLQLLCAFRRGEVCQAAIDRRELLRCERSACMIVNE